jgi:tetratricopeptide (TPR) repeat protein
VLRIETALLTRRNLLLVQGMGGSGKTTLLRHLAHWWELTGLVEGSFYFGWDERAWTRGQILWTLAPAVLPADVARAFDTMGEAAQQQAVAAALRAKRHLLILDNLESVTAAPLAIPHSLDEAGRQELRSFLAVLAGGASLVLLGSRSEEGWLAAGSFADNIHLLEGLDPEAASDLADAVLRRAGAQNRRTESAFRELMTLLAGYPLALQVVLPHLAAEGAAAVLDGLRQGVAEADAADPGSDPVAARTRSLMACIEYSHGHLDPEAQALLACFAPFTGVINATLLDDYQKTLAKEPALAELPLAGLGEVLERARGLGLVQRYATYENLFRPQPALSWFLTHRLAAADQTERRQAIERGYRKLYEEYAEALSHFQDEKDDPQRRQMVHVLVEQEYANLGTALRFAFDQQASIVKPFAVLSGYLDRLQDHRRGLELGELLLTWFDQLPPQALTGQRGVEFVGVIGSIAGRQGRLHQLDRARESYKRALIVLERLEGFGPDRAALMRASILHDLGNIARQQRRFDEAKTAYNEALEIALAFDDHLEAAAITLQLGTVALAQRHFDDADAAYRQALKVHIDFGDRDGAASAYYQLGRVAQEQRRLGDAEAASRQALEIYLELDDHHRAATAYHQLGTIIQEQRRFDEAEAAYKQALKTFVVFNDRYRQAGTYYQLGTVALEQRRFDEAEAACNKALEIKLAFDDRYGAANTYIVLGAVAHDQHRLDEAEAAYKQALEIYIALGDRARIVTTTHELYTIALEQRRSRLS